MTAHPSPSNGSANSAARIELNARLPEVVKSLVQSVHDLPTLQHLNRVTPPSRDVIIDIVKRLRQLTFPGFFGISGLTTENVAFRLGDLVIEVTEQLFEQIRCCLRYRNALPDTEKTQKCPDCDAEANRLVGIFFDRLPAVREMLAADVYAAFQSDPAAQSPDETIFCYPGLFAIFVQRMAHEFYKLQVPLLPRIMTEYAHSLTGIDIHPGAKLGRSFFIDHGTGVVIGETTEIGSNVKIYQGVTLGAVAPQYGQQLRGSKRHPTIEDDVIIYSGATILGGETVIGHGALIGGNVFITQSVPPYNRVTAEPPKLKYRERRHGKMNQQDILTDFQI
ncbi:serine O-acetyltransferase EpsC [Humisphaera borealis]|uniref:Serine acetyltransferase n=1 Tax=Humisphaera borealis TaxID=2807512 RepID=A0A7M2WV28_9BACT|nr:serine O-acetyltransferase EpsC [Humisphaera borealis]QOV89316.1 serine acetyltransferase [Humisphaera borealis]